VGPSHVLKDTGQHVQGQDWRVGATLKPRSRPDKHIIEAKLCRIQEAPLLRRAQCIHHA